MNTLEDIIDSDKKVTSLVKLLFESNPDFIESSECPNTTKLLFNLTKRLDYIKEGVFASATTNNYYSAQILLRTLIEHYLTFMYASQKLKNEKTDNIGKEYYLERNIEETIDFWEAHSKMLKTVNADEANTELERIIYEERFPELKNFTKKELVNKNKQFKVKEMIKYFLKDVDFKTLNDDTDVPALANLRHYKDWVQLSSFIHCGPLAEEMTLKYSDFDKKNERLVNISEYTFKISVGIKCLCLMHFTSITKDIKYFFLSEEINKISRNIKL